MKKLFITVLAFVLFLFANLSAKSQANVLDVNDPDVVFTATNQPALPTWNKISKWGHTNRLDWNPYSYGYLSYYFQGMGFRLKFPKSYKQGVTDGKKYPMFIFFHGLGEAGNIWDNEYQLFHGGQLFAQAVNDSSFDGFLLVPQSQGGYMQSYFPAISSLIDSMTKYTKLDLDRISVDGLSAGGQATWNFAGTQAYAQKICSMLPISAADYDTEPTFPSIVTIPIWTANGGQDVAPYPSTVTDIVNYFKSFGGNIIQSFYPNDGHDSWDDFWNEPNLWPWITAQHKTNPLVYFQHNAFCPGAAVNAKLAVQPGFFAYQWQKNGVTISGAVKDTLTVTAYGTYACRYQRTSTSGWSIWSPKPIVISQMQPTVTPPIQISGLRSNVLPAPDGSTTVPLMVPNTYASYEWHRATGVDTIVSTTNTYNAPIGQYKVRVTQQFGCSSNFSPIDTVVAANGVTVPPPATNPSALAISSSSIEVDWNSNPNPIYPQTGFEIYRSTTPGTGYKLVTITGSNALTYLDQGLNPAIKYYYIIRAINANGAAPITAEVSATTKSDVTPPTVPANLKVVTTTRASVSLAWDASTDDVAVSGYDIYVNGVKSYSTVNSSFTVNNLTALQTYSFYVKAKDASGNVSPASSQVSAAAALNGLTYSYYSGNWSVLPNFNTLTPLATGITPNVSLTPALATTLYGFLWQGSIIITKAGTYTFETSSDDGSALFIGKAYSATTTPTVNNDGLHGATTVTAKVTLAVGVYPFAATFFQNGGDASMNVYWTCTTAGISRQLIPNSAFADVVTPGAVPAKPSALSVTAASYSKINLTWVDNSTNETGFEVSRSTDRTGTYQALGTTAAGATSFIDSVDLDPSTKYWYKIRAVNANGASAYVSTLQASWLFNGGLTDASGNNHNLTGTGTPTYSTDKKEGSNSLSLNGTSQYVDMTSTGGAFPSDSYTSRTVGLWIKPTAATVSGTNRIVFNLGGSDNGIGLRFNSGSLIAGIASSSLRSTITVSSIATNANWVNGGWNYVALVYNTNTLQLYVNGVLKGSTTILLSSIGTSTVSSRIGASGSSNAFASSTSSTFFAGQIDDVEIIAEPLTAANIVSLMNQSYPADTTQALPATPAAPTTFTGTANGASGITLKFKDNATNETGFELYRAVSIDANFRYQATINPVAGSGSTVTYVDTAGLYANTNYYYKVRAIGVGGNSAFTSPDLLVTTLNTKPTITKISPVTMRYGSQVNVGVSATDVDGDPITFTTSSLPAFATLLNTGNGTASLQLNPASTDQGSYTVSIIANDNHSGADTTTFAVVVNSNYVPVLTAISNQTLNEGDSISIPLSATDQDGNSGLVWSVSPAASFITVSATANGTATITVKPGYTDAGNYTFIASVNDGNSGIALDTFTVVVVDKTPPAQRVFMSMRAGSPAAPAPWNNIYGTSTNNLVDADGNATGIGLQFLNTAWYGGNAGAVTYNNTAVYPDAAIADYYFFGIYGAPATADVQLTGLNTTATYNVTLFGSSTYTGAGTNGSTIYTINGVQKSLNIGFNQQNTVTFSSIAPDNSGNITVNLSLAAGSPYGAVNTIVLEKQVVDLTVPALPTNLAVQGLSNGYAQLSWKDVAYNELNYLVYRSTSATGTYTLLNAGATNANDTTYTDSTVSGSTTYYYKIAATNANGTSGQTAPVSLTTQNRVPSLTALNNISIRSGVSTVVNINATDDASSVLTTVVTNLPSFATYLKTGNGIGKITFTPTVNSVGVYKNVTVTVTDNFGAVVADTFNVTVTDSALRSVYVNFNGYNTATAPAPWNNYSSYPFVNSPVGNLLDDAGVNSGFSFKLLDTWDGNLVYGMITGSNSGVFPDNVLQTSIYSGNTNPHVIEIDGLSPTKRYDIGFLTTFNGGDTLPSTFASGTQTVSLDGRYNTTKVAQLNGLTPNASGAIQVTLTKGAAAAYLNVAAMVIQEYRSTTPIISPSSLFAETNEDTSTVKLTWTDKSNNETGFQIYRSNSANGTYTLIATTAANVTTYTNTGLTSNTRYYYKVRAINGSSVSSNYTNIATAKLAARIVFINLNVDATYNAPAPWNNTNAVSAVGATFSNLLDNKSVNTGFEMIITKGFNNAGYLGKNITGGIFPGAVMTSNYWTDASQTSEVLFDNLDLRRKYRIGCFGSNTSINFTTGAYSCNGSTVYLNSFDNSTKVVYLDNLVPNSNGQLYLDVTTVSGSPYSFTSAYTIEYYDDTDTYVPVSLNRPAALVEDTAEVLTAAAPVATTVDADNVSMNVYPNPFTDKFNVDIDGGKAGLVSLSLYDAASQLVYQGTANRQTGTQTINVNIPNANTLKAGSYVLNVVLDGQVTKSFVLIKVD